MVSAPMDLKPKKEPKPKYPKSVIFIICNELCERFNYYGMRTVLVLYMINKLNYSDDDATAWFHGFTSLAYFFPLVGAIIADSWLGRYKTIVYFSVIYAIGTVVLTLGAIPPLNLPAGAVTILGLVLIAAGTGGIKPNVSAFGGDQFKLPEQAKYLATFFSLFYVSINTGSMISTVLTPIFREDVKCFGETSCFSLAFGVPAALMIISILIFIIGKPLYRLVPPSENIIVKIVKCIVHALKTRSKERFTKPRYHLLDYAEPKYGKQLVYDIKCVAKILVLYIPFPLFWALFDQQSSRWTIQAQQMDGYVSENFTIKPDQMQVLNPVIVVFCVPLFNYVIYPMLEKIQINSPLRKMVVGMALCGAAFGVTGYLELELEKTYPVLPKEGQAQLRIFNGQPCGFEIHTTLPSHELIHLAPNSMWVEQYINVNGNKTFQYNATTEEGSTCEPVSLSGEFTLRSENATSLYLATTNNFVEYIDSPARSKTSTPINRILMTSRVENAHLDVITKEITIQNMQDGKSYEVQSNLTGPIEIVAGKYKVLVDGIEIGTMNMTYGGVYTTIINQISQDKFTLEVHTISNPPTVHILWLIPQYVIVSAGEIMFSVTGLEFSFTQAPSSMKSVLQAFWLLMVTFGNIIVVIITQIKFFESQAYEFFLYVVLMAINVMLFVYLAMKYKYRTVIEDVENNELATRNANVINMNSVPSMDETFTVSPTTATPTNKRPSLSNASMNNSEKLDSSPKCLKRNSSGKNGVDNYGYIDI